MTTRRWLLPAVAAVAVLLLVGRIMAGMYVDYAWFASMGATEVWRTRTLAMLVLRGASWLAATLFVFLNLYVVRQSVVSLVVPRRLANLEIGEEVSNRYLLVAVVIMSVVLGTLLTLPAEDWSSLVLARAGRPFGETDPYFQADLGFFVYWLPFERLIYTWTLISIFIVSAIVLFLYALTPSLRWERGTVYISAYVRRHLTVLAGVLMLMLAWSYRLDMYALLIHGSGADGMFSYIDHRVGIPACLILGIVTFCAALIVVWAGWTGQLRLAGLAILGVLVLSVTMREAAPFIVAHFLDEGDPVLRERPYQAVNAGYTRRAYALDAILTDSSLAFTSVADASRGVSLWDPAALLRALRHPALADPATQALGWHDSPSGLVIDVPARPPRADSVRLPWTLDRVLAPSVDDQGDPVHVDGAGSPSLADVQLLAPTVLDTATGYAILPDSLNRITGSSLESALSRLAHAWSFQQPRLLFDELPRPHPTVVLHRSVRERLRELVPFFAQGSSVNPIVVGDSLFWEVDLYSVSASYPLSRRTLAAGDLRTYFKHAATGLIFASTGETYIVPDSVLDPIAATLVERFPALFTTWTSLPTSISDRLPPAIDAASAQAIQFGRFGNRSGTSIQRQPPILDGADSAVAGADPFFVLPRVAGTPSTGAPAVVSTRGGSVAYSIPLLDSGERVRGLILAIGGRVRRTLWYPTKNDGGRWIAIIDALRGTDTMTATRDAPLYRGAVHAYPVSGSIAYVQSTYRWRSDAPPALAHVSLLWGEGDSVRTAHTLASMAGAAGVREGQPVASVAALASFRDRVNVLYRAMRSALQRGDFTAFGRALDELGTLLGARRAP